MKSITLLLLSIVSFGIIACNNSTQKETKTVVTNVAPIAFKKLIEKNNGIILDVRTPEEINQGHISGASIINFYDKAFVDKINLMQKSKTIYVYCRSGGRSSKAAEILINNGFKNVYNLSGGIGSWTSKGFATVVPDAHIDTHIQSLSLNDFNTILKNNTAVLVDFHTKWCAPCKKMAPIVDSLEQEFKGKAMVLRIDVDNSKEIAKAYNIEGVPVFITFKNTKEVWRKKGLIPKTELKENINKLILAVK